MASKLFSGVRDRLSGSEADVLYEDTGLVEEKVYVLDLVPFVEALGGEDSRAADKVSLICDMVLENRLFAAGVYSRFGERTFIFRFDGGNDDEGWRRAIAIVNEVGTKLIGLSFVESEGPRMLAAVGAEELVDDDGEVDAGKVRAALGSIDAGREQTYADEEPDWQETRHGEGSAGPAGSTISGAGSRVLGVDGGGSGPDNLWHDRDWRPQDPTGRAWKSRVQRRDERRRASLGPLGDERRVDSHGRRAGDDPSQHVWR